MNDDLVGSVQRALGPLFRMFDPPGLRRSGGRSGAVFLAGLVGLASVLVLGGCGLTPMEPRRLVRADVIVVLGNRPPRDSRGRVRHETARRVDRGVRLYFSGLASRLAFAGGPAPGGGTEAEVMAAYAQSLGVPRSVMLLERQSRNTIENARNTHALLCRGQSDCRPRILLVTSDYHLNRAAELFRCAGFIVQPVAAHLEQSRARRRAQRWRERTVRLYYAFIDQCGRARGQDD